MREGRLALNVGDVMHSTLYTGPPGVTTLLPPSWKHEHVFQGLPELQRAYSSHAPALKEPTAESRLAFAAASESCCPPWRTSTANLQESRFGAPQAQVPRYEGGCFKLRGPPKYVK